MGLLKTGSIVFKVKNIANILTLMRIGLIPILIGLFYIEAPFSFITASILFLIACLTDYFDGGLLD